MSEINFVITKAWPGSEAQKKVGIHATFNMNVEGPDGVVLSVNDMKLMTSKEGKYYIDSAFRTYDDKEGNKKKINYVRFFPEKKDWDKQDAIVRLVLDQIKSAAPTPGTKSQAAKPAPAKAAAKPPVDQSDDW
jgi:hypothetical protein